MTNFKIRFRENSPEFCNCSSTTLSLYLCSYESENPSHRGFRLNCTSALSRHRIHTGVYSPKLIPPLPLYGALWNRTTRWVWTQEH